MREKAGSVIQMQPHQKYSFIAEQNLAVHPVRVYIVQHPVKYLPARTKSRRKSRIYRREDKNAINLHEQSTNGSIFCPIIWTVRVFAAQRAADFGLMKLVIYFDLMRLYFKIRFWRGVLRYLLLNKCYYRMPLKMSIFTQQKAIDLVNLYFL